MDPWELEPEEVADLDPEAWADLNPKVVEE